MILDVGSGYGDMLRLIDRWARARSLDVRLLGLDRNPWAARAAERAPGSQDETPRAACSAPCGFRAVRPRAARLWPQRERDLPKHW